MRLPFLGLRARAFIPVFCGICWAFSGCQSAPIDAGTGGQVDEPVDNAPPVDDPAIDEPATDPVPDDDTPGIEPAGPNASDLDGDGAITAADFDIFNRLISGDLDIRDYPDVDYDGDDKLTQQDYQIWYNQIEDTDR